MNKTNSTPIEKQLLGSEITVQDSNLSNSAALHDQQILDDGTDEQFEAIIGNKIEDNIYSLSTEVTVMSRPLNLNSITSSHLSTDIGNGDEHNITFFPIFPNKEGLDNETINF
jgi:hypothetical protein